MLKNMTRRVQDLDGDTRRFVLGVMGFAFGGALLDSIFNNLLAARYDIDSLQRTLLEIPRELPGLLVVFVSALLLFLPSRRLAAFSGLLGGIGLLGLAWFSPSFWTMAPWLFVYSLGQHLLMPVQSAIAMDLARSGEAGKRLGQVNALRNVAVIVGSALVFVGFRYLHMGFVATLVLAALSLVVAGALFWRMQPGTAHASGLMLRIHPQYKVYYILCVLFGTRKQIFLTFAPWVLVSVFAQPTARIAELLTLGAALGIVLQPLVGKLVDHMGERFVLALEAILLLPVCLGYAFARDHLNAFWALGLVAFCFLADQALMGFGIARSTWLKKIAIDKSHITPTLTMAVSMDHFFSIAIALMGGVLWQHLGYQAVFLGGAGIALVNLVVVLTGMRGKAETAV